MQYLPLFFRLKQVRVLLVGGGQVARRKAELLHKAGASITVLAPEIEPELKAALQDNGGHWQQAGYHSRYLDQVRMVIAATPHVAVNQQVFSDATERGIPVNVVDDPALCSFIFPAIVDRDPLLIGISSAGLSPVLARQVRARIEAVLPAAYGRLVEFAGRFRALVAERIANIDQRRSFWEKLLAGPVAEKVLSGSEGDAEALLLSALQEGAAGLPTGEVFLIGAGPGDPDLLTFKAARLLQAADVVLYDRLVSPQVLEMSRRDAQRLYVGKRRADHSMAQPDINTLLLELAQQGKRVARLKGGDPFVFGRGGEEIELLAEHNIPFQVVPGITAASGCACYAGIPLTHRDYAQSVRFVAGNLKDNQLDLPWADLVSSSETLVFYMGLQCLGIICQQLQAHGRAGTTPVALVEQGTTPHQRTLTATLATMVDTVNAVEVHAPTLIIVGEVVALREKLAWYGETGAPGRWPPAPVVL